MALALSLLLLTSQGCGYALAGHGSFLPSYIRQIGIPAFANQTSYFDIAQILTDKVRTEFIGRGNYKIVPETTGADAVLVGTITGISILPAAFGNQQQASRYTITVTANIELRDSRENKVMWVGSCNMRYLSPKRRAHALSKLGAPMTRVPPGVSTRTLVAAV